MTSSTGQSPGKLGKPVLGLVVLAVTISAQPVARTINRLVLNTTGDYAFWGFILMGLLGSVLIAAYLDDEEVKASVAGFFGGMLVWHGLAEGCLRFFADQFGVDKIQYGGFPLDGRYALLMATATILLALFTVFGLLNRETRCNFMRWILRRLHWSPGNPTPGYQRSYARIAALETLFVQWLVFLLFLYLGGRFGSGFYLSMLAWCSFLIWRLFRYPRAGLAFRYAIPIAVVLFSLVEVGAFFGAYPEYWKDLLAYPVSNLATLGVFGTGVWLLLVRIPSNARAKE
jgi:hypothetical protein